MTTPQDPFAAPDPQQPATPTYGEPASAGSYGYTSPTPYGQAPAAGWQGPALATWGTRVGGYLIDFVISLAVQLVVGFVNEGLGQVAGLGVFFYFCYLTGTTGQTPGRKAVGIKVLREADGQPIGVGAGIGRGFLHILDALPLGLGFLWPIWDAKKQTFADKIIKSVVVKL